MRDILMDILGKKIDRIFVDDHSNFKIMAEGTHVTIEERKNKCCGCKPNGFKIKLNGEEVCNA